MKFNMSLALGLLVLGAGCAAPPEKIVFSDEAEIRAATASVAPRLPPIDWRRPTN